VARKTTPPIAEIKAIIRRGEGLSMIGTPTLNIYLLSRKCKQ
jgi:hypothetical protein